jgi:hypothetical protein
MRAQIVERVHMRARNVFDSARRTFHVRSASPAHPHVLSGALRASGTASKMFGARLKCF